VSIFAQISFYFPIIMAHLCSYACKFVIGLSIYIKSRKVRREPSLIAIKDFLTTGVRSYIFPQHIDIIFASQDAYIKYFKYCIALMFSIVISHGTAHNKDSL